VLGRGLAGRWEVSYEVEPGARGPGLGRALAAEALGLLPAGTPVFAQVAPGNSLSLRATLAAGYRPIGGEVLLRTAPPSYNRSSNRPHALRESMSGGLTNAWGLGRTVQHNNGDRRGSMKQGASAAGALYGSEGRCRHR
jgi:hypothetical protein